MRCLLQIEGWIDRGKEEEERGGCSRVVVVVLNDYLGLSFRSNRNLEWFASHRARIHRVRYCFQLGQFPPPCFNFVLCSCPLPFVFFRSPK